MEIKRKIDDVNFIDSYQLWNSLSNVAAEDRAREIMRNGGAQFFDEEKFYVKQPSVAIIGIGGIPVRWTDQTPTDSIELACAKNVPMNISTIRQSMLDMIGFGGFFTYLNPRNHSPEAMQQIMQDHNHFSTAHSVYLNFMILGISTAVENEFNSQRDLIHLTRLTEARTQSQSSPSVVVLYPEYLNLYQQVLSQSQKMAESVSISPINKADGLETRNLLFPAAKATILGINATVRNLQKLVDGIEDKGKEEEYRRAVAMINDNLAALIPTMFKRSAERGFHYPAHFKEGNND